MRLISIQKGMILAFLLASVSDVEMMPTIFNARAQQGSMGKESSQCNEIIVVDSQSTWQNIALLTEEAMAKVNDDCWRTVNICLTHRHFPDSPIVYRTSIRHNIADTLYYIHIAKDGVWFAIIQYTFPEGKCHIIGEPRHCTWQMLERLSPHQVKEMLPPDKYMMWTIWCNEDVNLTAHWKHLLIICKGLQDEGFYVNKEALLETRTFSE